MDQLKDKLSGVLRYGFWIGTTIVLIGSVTVWYLAQSRLREEHAERTQELETDVQTVRSVQSELSSHPNELSHELMRGLIDQRKEEVLQAWQRVFEEQQDILTWPVEQLGEDLVDEYRGKLPIEKDIDFPPTAQQQVVTDLRQRYARYIGDVLPGIAEIAGAKWTAEFEKTGNAYGGYGTEMMGGPEGMGGFEGPGGGYGPGMAGGRRARTEELPLVQWPTQSQQMVLEDLFPWRGSRPTTLEVYYSQENLWVLKQLMRIVAHVNEGAQQPFQAKIRRINQIKIGESVEFGQGEIAEPGEGAPGAGGGGMYGSMGMQGMGGMEGMDSAAYDNEDPMAGSGGGASGPGGMEYSMTGGGESGGGQSDPAENRYVNMQNEPIAASTLRSALMSQRPEDATIAVAKRLPVMMSVDIDQRYIPNLLAACGNAQLMLEVKQVRILPKGQSQSGGYGGFGGGSGSYEDSMPSMESPDGGMYGGGSMMPGGGSMMPGGGSGGSGARGGQKYPFDMRAEVYGLIYIYNPPDPEKLGVEQVTEDTVIDGSAVPSEQADEPEPQQPPAQQQPDGQQPAAEPDGQQPAAEPAQSPDGTLPAPAGDGAATPAPPASSEGSAGQAPPAAGTNDPSGGADTDADGTESGADADSGPASAVPPTPPAENGGPQPAP